MRTYEKKEVIKNEKVLKTINCDTCNRNIKDTNGNYFFNVSILDDTWTNESTYEHLDFCSYNCLIKNMNEYFSKNKDIFSYEIEKESKKKL